MKIDLFVLPEVMRADFIEAFVLDREDLRTVQAEHIARLAALGLDFDEWYSEAYLWEKLSPDLPVVDFDTALSLLRSRQGTVLFMSEPESSHKPCSLTYRGREVTDFVAMADPRELAALIEYEWLESARLLWEEDRLMEDGILPNDLYVFDTTLDWVIVFTHETDPHAPNTRSGTESRFCRAFGWEL